MISKLNLPLLLLSVLLICALGCTEEEKILTHIDGKVGFNHVGGYVAAAPMVADGFVYTATGTGAVCKQELASGKILWQYEEVGGYINSTPVVTKDSVIIIGSKGKLVSIDVKTGEKKWEKPDDLGWTAEAKAIDMNTVQGCLGYDADCGIMVMGDTDGHVMGLNAKDGTVLWSRDLYARILAVPVFVDEMVLLSTMGGRVHGLKTKDGTDHWQVSKVLAKGASGTIFTKKGEDGVPDEIKYSLVVNYLYNFDPTDYFGHEEGDEGSNLTIQVLDDDDKPVKYEDNEQEILDTIRLDGINPGGHTGSGSQVQKSEINLVSAPPQRKDWPIKIVIKDHKGTLLDSMETTVTFKSSDKDE